MLVISGCGNENITDYSEIVSKAESQEVITDSKAFKDYESFLDFEIKDSNSAWNVWLSACEPDPDEYADIPDDIDDLKEIVSCLEDEIDVIQDFDPHFSNSYMQALEISNRLMNNLPGDVDIFPPQMIATLVIDYMCYNSDTFESSIISDILEASVLRIRSIFTFNLNTRTRIEQQYDLTSKRIFYKILSSTLEFLNKQEEEPSYEVDDEGAQDIEIVPCEAENKNEEAMYLL